MPDAIITATESTFGTISGTFSADQSTVTGTVTGVITGTLDGSVGVPGPAGPGVPAGGTAGQILQKIDGTNYNTDWVTVNFSATWGDITGTLSSQTDLQTALDLKAPLASPALTGVPTAPTAATLTSTTQLATTAFVQQELLSGTANARNLEVYVRNQTGSTLAAGTIVYINGATGNRPTVTPAQANNDANSAQTLGFTKASIANNGFGFVIVRGELENIDTSALTEGVQLYLSPTTAGTWTTTKPSAPQHLVYVGICVRAHPTQGVILVAVQNGYELDELHDVAIGTLANNDLLAYESSTDLWKNKTYSALGLLTSADLSGYATESWVTSGFYPLSGNPSSFLDSAVADTLYYSIGNPSGFITYYDASVAFYPLSGNPSSFLVAADIANKADIASPTFTGVPAAPTASPGTDTTQLATTAFVTAAVPAFATFTTPEVNSTNTIVSPRVAMDYIMHPGRTEWLKFGSGATSGAGASVIGPASTRSVELVGPNAGVAGYAMAVWDTSFSGVGMFGMTRGANMLARAWNKPVWASGRGQIGFYANDVYNGDAHSTIRVSVGGKSSVGSGPISINDPGFGWLVPGVGSALQLQVSLGNGSALTTVTSSFTPVAKQIFDWKMHSDGAGNVTLWINDDVVATTANGPTTSTPEVYNFYFEMVEQTASTATRVVWESLNSRLWWGV
jgi:hypothetical protein